MATMSLQAAYDQARSYLEANKVEQAIGVAQHILEHFPENLEAHRILGEAYLASRTFDQAEVSFGRVLNADPENIPAHVGLGITYERQAKLDQAVAEFEQALEVRPDMPELRSQLLRLYTDVWGSEGATLRLSRPGLARLYAKGHMLPQAIQEFRSVIDEMPERFDARVGLAEALWRDGQEDAAAEVCEEILAARPEVLKANLLLGYIKLAAGDESGEAYWRVAQQLDPYHTVARVLFDTLPDVPAPDLSIPQWDEAGWAERRAADEAERRAADEADHRAQQAAVAPAVAGGAAAGAASAAADEDDFFSADWMREPDPDAPAPALTQRAAESPGVNDDFLASLLGFDDDATDTSGGVDLDSSSGITPFNFDDVDSTARAAAPAEPSMLDVADLTPTPADPLSLDDLGLSFDEPEKRAPAAPAAEEAPALSPIEQEMAPFSLADLGLSDDEIAELTGAPASPAAPAAEQPPADANPELAPLSLADLGLSDDEIAQLDDAGSGAPPPADEPELTPFSFDDLGLSEGESAQLNAAGASPAAEPELTPFSFDDLGLSDDEIAQLNAAGASPAAEPELTPLSLADLGLSDDEIAQLNAAGPGAPPADEPEITPFSLAELGLSDDEIAQLDSASDSSPAAPATPFSLDDLGLADDPFSPPAASSPPARSETPVGDTIQPFDWGIGDESDAQASTGMEGVDSQLLGELEPFSLDDLDLNATDEGGLGAGSLPPSLQPFSLDDASMTPPPGGMPGAGPLPPIDIDDQSEGGGYSWQQPSAKRSTDFLRQQEQAEAQSGSIFAKLKQRAQDVPKADDEPLPPVTLSDDETAAYFSSDDVPLREDDGTPERLTGRFRLPREGEAEDRGGANLPPAAAGIAAGAAAAPIPDELAPFSLDKLGLSPDEIAALEGTSTPGQAASKPADAEPELTPFSFEELGLSPDEAGAEPELTPFSFEELGLSPDEIAALEGAGVPTTPPAAQPADAEPELTPFSFEELGLSPDEIAALEGAGTPAQAASKPADAEPELTPFSFEELGLSPDEIAALEGAGVPTTPPAAQPADAEPELTPFSFDELGLSPDEIAALEGTGVPTTPPTPTPAPADAEPELTPFSLADLGLSSDEIAALEGANTGDTIVPGWSKGQEPELTPFSLEESALAEAGDDTAGLEPFSFEEFDLDNIDSIDSTASSSPAADEAFAADVQPFSLDDLGLDDLDGPGGPNNSRELDLTDEELAGMDLGSFETLIEPSAEPEPEVVTGDPALDKLINLGRRQGFVDLTDIISVVDDPEAEAERIEEIGWTLHRAGIQIRDGDEIIDMEEAEEAGAEADELAEPMAEPAGSPVVSADADMTPFSFTDLGLSDEDIAALGLGGAEPATSAPGSGGAAAPPPTDAEPELTPFSLEELGLSPDEIAALGLDTAAPASPPAEPAPQPQAEAEPELAPFSLEELGLSPDEIAALEGASTATPAPGDTEPELAPFSLEELGLSPDEIAALEGANAPTESATSDAEPELAPFSLEELGLSPDEIAALGSANAAAAAPPASDAEPELAPFSLEELGLSPDEIAALESAGVEAAPAADDDPFDFGLSEVVPVERAVRTAPREEEPPPPVSPADSSFTPEPLDQLDNIWDVPAPAAAAPAAAAVATPEPAKPAAPQPAKPAEPARVVLPPRSREEAPPKPRDSGRANASRTPAPTRDDARYARREAARADRPTRPTERSAPAVRSLADYIPTGDDVLDDYLRQLDAEPDNHALALAVARLCAQTGRADLATLAYKRPIRDGQLLDAIAEEVESLVGAVGDSGVQRQLYRVLGDVYSKQGRLREAMAAYGNTFAH